MVLLPIEQMQDLDLRKTKYHLYEEAAPDYIPELLSQSFLSVACLFVCLENQREANQMLFSIVLCLVSFCIGWNPYL